MNALAARPGWRDMAIWVMPSAVYALASDTIIGVIRASALAKHAQLRDLAAGETTPLAILGGFLLWVLRLALDRSGTWRGFRSWVVESCPVAPGRRAEVTAPNVAALAAAPTPVSAAIPTTEPAPETQVSDTGRRPADRADQARGTSKRAQLIEAYEAMNGTDARYGDRSQVSPIARELAPGAGLAWSSARTSLYRHLDARAEASS